MDDLHRLIERTRHYCPITLGDELADAVNDLRRELKKACRLLAAVKASSHIVTDSGCGDWWESRDALLMALGVPK